MSFIPSNDGTQIAYDVFGEGQAVILVDGATTSRAFGSSIVLAQALAKQGFKACAYDRRGRNESGNTQPYDRMREVEDIKALIDELGEPAFLYGISSGAALAIEAASVLGDKVAKLAIYEVPYVAADKTAPARPADGVERLKQLVAEGKNGEVFEYYMVQIVGLPQEMVAGMRGAPFWPAMEAVAPSLVHDATILYAHNWMAPEELLSKITAPVLAITGTVSLPGMGTRYMAAAAQKVATGVRHGEYAVLEGQGHDIDSEALAPVLAKFYHAQ